MTKYTAHAATHNEGGYGFNPHEAAMQAAARAAANDRIESLVPRFDEIRSAWNAAVAKYAVNGQISMGALAKIESEVGATRSELLAVKARVGK